MNMVAYIDAALAENLTLKYSMLAEDLAKEDINRSAAVHYPRFDLVASRNRRNTKGPEFGGSEGDVDSTQYLVRFSFPIYQGGSVESRMRESINIHSKVKEEVTAQRRKITRETRAAYRGVTSGINRIAVLKESIEAQQSALEVKKKGLKAGLITLLEVLDAQRELYFAQRQYSRVRYDYLINVIKLKQAAGNLTEEDLVEINNLIQ